MSATRRNTSARWIPCKLSHSSASRRASNFPESVVQRQTISLSEATARYQSIRDPWLTSASAFDSLASLNLMNTLDDASRDARNAPASLTGVLKRLGTANFAADTAMNYLTAFLELSRTLSVRESITAVRSKLEIKFTGSWETDCEVTTWLYRNCVFAL